MSKKGELSRKDVSLLSVYVKHLEAMRRDVETEADVLDELEWLTENGFCKKVKEGVYGKTKKGKILESILKQIEKENSTEGEKG